METGTCSRWVTMGCCCEAMSDFTAALNLECAALPPAPWEQPIFIAPNHDTRPTAR